MGDVQRERCTEALSDAFVTGRLPLEEFDRRVELALKAQTDVDLDQLTRDLHVSTQVDKPTQARARGAMTARTAMGAVAFQITLILIAQVAGAAFDSASVSHALITLMIWLGGSTCGALGLLLTRPTHLLPQLTKPDNISSTAH